MKKKISRLVFLASIFGATLGYLIFRTAPKAQAAFSTDEILLLAQCPALLDARRQESLEEIISSAREASLSYKIDPALIYAVIMVESRCTPRARSRAGALGLMQLMPATAKWLGVRDPLEIRANVHGGAKYLAYLLEEFDGDMHRALAAYNAGPTRIKQNARWSCKETKRYVERVMRLYRELQTAPVTQSEPSQAV